MQLRWILPALLAVFGSWAAPAPVDSFEKSLEERDDLSAASSKIYIPASTLKTDILAAKGLVNLAFYQITHPSGGSCNLLNAAIRREWSTLSKAERREYIDAELCLMSKPSEDPAFAAGAKTRYDDFVAVHINQTLSIHGTANFLAWHRYFTWSFEQALRNECGYTGYQPYWNWGKYAFDPLNSPLFDGSDYSMSGNGAFEEHGCTNALPTGLNCIPPGSGGGCVNTGPFKDYVVNLGPVSPTLDIPGIINYSNPDPLAYNPRCLRRDISSWVSSNWTKDSDSYDLISNYDDIESFQDRMQGDFPNGYYGVHTGGHFTTGGDPGGDLFASPAEPSFFLHHAQIDRTWWIWQNQDLENRKNAFGGGTSTLDPVNSPRGQLTDPIIMGSLSTTVQNQDVMSTTEGPLCYIYV
ncbi:uncharacterized protein Z518_02360 [Rhinocladiella mackenziei CBS 650.93]|uniref:Tyrosinase copper-binding domain-containing protein n=1 Tax=Rhinocladiella mackenziei CBS 650.93 TaxID=1442369 RepID=A0A0D2IWH9_9EURO|nr:uncharacterized protein Z518_02360 [Rhinocladiella mackenziei CBS 650.93]KIX07706.1 hypothetical protein Z518_02360 [Rhinocladiella mackenziei CBS 650.93]